MIDDNDKKAVVEMDGAAAWCYTIGFGVVALMRLRYSVQVKYAWNSAKKTMTSLSATGFPHEKLAGQGQ